MLAVVGLVAVSRAALQPQLRSASLVRSAHVVCTTPVDQAPAVDLVGDGGVLKSISRAGEGAAPQKGAVVEVHYVGMLPETGAVFDSSRARGKPFKFTVGEGKVIGGWEVGVPSMLPGEMATLTCAPQYAYGEKGIPPTIPPSSTLQFEIELLSVQAPASEASSFAEFNQAPRTPSEIKEAYQQKMAQKASPLEGVEGFINWAKNIYIFGLFSSKGERPPWYLNPLVTFPTIFAFVGVLFYLVIILDGVHRGTAIPDGDDLSSFISDMPAP
ncbi:hypothetical protein AB1Y20_003878 [Prymnesium parvum]|uniref:peptidylprolyl isomerase n=1 Tax=Prymnesium parvum TaxID=97485 RepID=A0AB34J5W4_PRYPA